ncbi:MAG TPA: hypothetical protein VFU59_07220 [Candidatus Eisenbacteria bacterium]|nr:hypothetical protein [Candidatus Eisenbacteria bacterium]
MTSRRRRLPTQGWVVVAALLLAAAGTPNVLHASPHAAPDSTRAPDSVSAPDSARVSSAALAADSARAADSLRAAAPRPLAYVAVETRPPGLRVTFGSVEVGWSPLPPTAVPSGRVRVRAYPVDSRRFEPAIDGLTVDAAPGETIRVSLDLRSHPLLHSEPAATLSLLARRDDAPDSAVGVTPLRLAPAVLESRRVRFEANGFADSVVPGAWLLDEAARGKGVARVALRSLHLPPPAPPPPPSLLGRKWFQLGLVGVGALLTGGAAIIRHQGDLAYDRYLEASDPRVIEREYDRTVHYDRLSAATLGTGQVMFTAGLFFLVTGIGK